MQLPSLALSITYYALSSVSIPTESLRLFNSITIQPLETTFKIKKEKPQLQMLNKKRQMLIK